MKIETYLKVISLLLFTVSPLFAQDNTPLIGKISAPLLEEAAVHIINATQKTGTVNAASGSFQILVKENDELLFSSIQYKNITIIITSEMMKSGILEVLLKEDVNILAEVNISNINLTGNISTDIMNMQVLDDLPLNYGLSDIKDMNFEADLNDAQEGPVNRAFYANEIIKPGGVNILGLPGAIMDIFGIEEKPKPRIYNNSEKTSKEQLNELFQKDFFVNTLALNEGSIDGFIYYAEDHGLSRVLKNSNELILVEFLINQSKSYNKEIKNN